MSQSFTGGQAQVISLGAKQIQFKGQAEGGGVGSLRQAFMYANNNKSTKQGLKPEKFSTESKLTFPGYGMFYLHNQGQLRGPLHQNRRAVYPKDDLSCYHLGKRNGL